MEQIVLVGFLPMNNGRTCEVHPFGCGNLLVLNREDYGVGIVLRLRLVVTDELACYTVCYDGTDGWHVCFAA